MMPAALGMLGAMNPTLSIITGASRGLGRAVAEQLLERGHQVIALSRQPPAGLAGPGLQHWPHSQPVW